MGGRPTAAAPTGTAPPTRDEHHERLKTVKFGVFPRFHAYFLAHDFTLRRVTSLVMYTSWRFICIVTGGGHPRKADELGEPRPAREHADGCRRCRTGDPGRIMSGTGFYASDLPEQPFCVHSTRRGRLCAWCVSVIATPCWARYCHHAPRMMVVPSHTSPQMRCWYCPALVMYRTHLMVW